MMQTLTLQFFPQKLDRQSNEQTTTSDAATTYQRQLTLLSQYPNLMKFNLSRRHFPQSKMCKVVAIYLYSLPSPAY